MDPTLDLSHDVLVRHVRTDALADASLFAVGGELRGLEDHERIAGFRYASSERDYMAARALTRATLTERLGSDPRQAPAPAGGVQAGEVVARAGSQPMRFSLAHADGIAVCAVTSGQPVGVDVESARNLGHDFGDVASVVCSAPELRYLETLAGDARIERFLTIWARKEAIAKALGLGFRLPFDTIPVDDSVVGASQVNVVSQRLGPHHVAAVALVRSGQSERFSVHFEEVGLDTLQWVNAD